MSNLNSNTTELQSILDAINNLPEAGSGGTDTSDATAVAGDILSGKIAYVKGEKVTGTIATATQATPSITVSSAGLITASATQTAGYVAAGTKSGTKQLTTQAATTYTPTTSNQTIAAGTYCSGTQTIKGDANLKAANIASGVSIFGVTGTHSGAEDLNTELTIQESLISQLSTILDSKASGGSGGGGVEYEIITIPAGATSATYTLPRVTNAYGAIIDFYNEYNIPPRALVGIVDNCTSIIMDALDGCVVGDTYQVYYNQGTITWTEGSIVKNMSLLLINDSSKDTPWWCTPS